MKILLVEDNPNDIDLIVKNLNSSQKVKPEITIVGTLHEATKMANEVKFDVILLDFSVSDSKGIDTVKHASSEIMDTPVIVLTGVWDEDLGIKAVHDGAEDYLVKDSVSGRVLSMSIVHALERYKLKEELREMSLFDDLTHLYNRRGFKALSAQLLKRVKRYKNPFALFFIDIDKMKDINDSHGHLKGDVALIDFALILKNTFRESDIISRFGGDEFVILLEDVKENFAEEIEKRLSEKVGLYNEKKERGFGLSISVGVKYVENASDVTIDQVLHEADERMYKRKNKKK